MTDQLELTEVTAEEWSAIRVDLEKLLKIKQKKDEDLPTYALRLARTANDPKKVGDDDWETLEEITQRWVNGANTAAEKGESVPLPEVDETEALEEDQAAGEDEAAEAPASAPKKTPAVKKKTAGQKAAKPAAPKKAAAAPKKAAAKEATKAGRPTLFEPADVITIVEKEPFRAGTMSALGYAKMKSGMTVKKALEAGTPRRLIRWANICGYITVAAAK